MVMCGDNGIFLVGTLTVVSLIAVATRGDGDGLTPAPRLTYTSPSVDGRPPAPQDCRGGHNPAASTLLKLRHSKRKEHAMTLTTLSAVSPVDGRYRSATAPLSDFFSEGGLIRYRVRIEVEYFLWIFKRAVNLIIVVASPCSIFGMSHARSFRVQLFVPDERLEPDVIIPGLNE